MASWRRFLERLEERGLTAERGLELLIYDGARGLETALEMVYFGPEVQHQRCLFHKLQNVRRAVVGAEEMSRQERQQRRAAVVAAARAVYFEHDPDAATSRQRLAAFRVQWAEREPDAVATLERDFEPTLVYLTVRDRARRCGLTYRLNCLRTTSALERVNRHLRQKARQVVIFQAEAGVAAALELVICHRHLVLLAAEPWTRLLEEALLAA